MMDYGMIFMTGLLASLHCAGMCGALVLGYSARIAGEVPGVGRSFGRGALLHLAYNGGRILSYAFIGAILSAAALRLAWFKDAGSYVSIAGGAVMVVAGLAMLGIVRIPSRVALPVAREGGLRLHSRLLRGATPAHTFGLGVLTPLLPCGILYAMLARAAAAPSVSDGAMIMGIFGLGMTPSLAALGSVSRFLSLRARTWAERLAALSIILMGVVLLLRGFHVPFLGLFEPAGQSCCAPVPM
jgi:sulfite exporter TauE/SafE